MSYFLQNGFVNSLAFAHSGRFLLAGTGQVCQCSSMKQLSCVLEVSALDNSTPVFPFSAVR